MYVTVVSQIIKIKYKNHVKKSFKVAKFTLKINSMAKRRYCGNRLKEKNFMADRGRVELDDPVPVELPF